MSVTEAQAEHGRGPASPEIGDAQLRLLVEHLPALCWIANPDGYIFWYNRRWHAYCGTTPAEMEGWGWQSVHDPMILPSVLERWAGCIESGVSFEMIFPLKGADGLFRPFLTKIHPVRDGADAILCWVGTNTDVSVEIDAQMALRSSETLLRELNQTLEIKVAEQTRELGRTWALSPDLLCVLDADGRFEATNPAWRKTLGWSEAELREAGFVDLIHPDYLASSRAAWGRIQGEQSVLRVENRYRRKAGGWCWLSWTAVAERDKVYCIGRDISTEKEQAAALAMAEEGLRQSQKMEAVGQLTGGIAHDFNNLLTGITGSLEMMRTRLEQGRIDGFDRFIEIAESSARRAAALTQRLLAFSRRQTLDPRSTDVNGLIDGLRELIERTIGPSIELRFLGDAALWFTLIDPSQLESALLNLCINARDAMPNGGSLTIQTANRSLDDRAAAERELPAGNYIALSVTDTGTGMTTEVIARAVDPFFTTKPLGEGTGLGLSMVYGFARQSGGQLRIHSQLGQGTTMRLYLPRHGEGPAVSEPPSDPAPAPARGSGEIVLVIDDEPSIRMLIREILEESGYMALEAEDGAGGLRILRSETRIDLLITDFGLPGGIDGRQIADAGRAIKPDLKILFITGYAANAVLGHGHLEPGMHMVTKPFAMDALGRRIREIIEG